MSEEERSRRMCRTSFSIRNYDVARSAARSRRRDTERAPTDQGCDRRLLHERGSDEYNLVLGRTARRDQDRLAAAAWRLTGMRVISYGKEEAVLHGVRTRSAGR